MSFNREMVQQQHHLIMLRDHLPVKVDPFLSYFLQWFYSLRNFIRHIVIKQGFNIEEIAALFFITNTFFS